MPIPRMFRNDSVDPELTNYNPRLAQIFVIKEVASKFFICDIDGAIDDGYPNMHVTKRLRPLHIAAFHNSVERVSKLVSAGARIDAIDEVGYTPLHYCTIFGCVDALEELLRLGARVDFDQSSLPACKQTKAEQPIRLAMECNQAKCADILLKHGAKPDTEYFRGSEINLVALEYIDCLEILLKHGAKPDVYNKLGQTPLMKACKECNVSAVKLLLQYGASVNLKFQRFDKKSVLFYAIFGGNPEIVKLLLDAGADASLPVDSTTSPLSMAVHHSYAAMSKYQICQMLLRHGADVDAIDQTFHCSALSTACGRKNVPAKLVRLLLEYGANVNYTDGVSPSPLVKYLLTSRESYDFDVVHTLIKYGAIVHITSPGSDSSQGDPFSVLSGMFNVQNDEDILDILYNATEVLNLDMSLYSRDGLSRVLWRLAREGVSRAASNPHGLKNSVRLLLRKVLRNCGSHLLTEVERLPLPNILKSYILFEAQ
ncbi:ankyrin repeat and SOCS box protein 13-like [Lineus longissimus]|uniref:ankyrin repeat and SOCS box protein 13-like n=1 Tax=Lineus longissimus TaxID=88925 RepID=UPI00315DD2D3